MIIYAVNVHTGGGGVLLDELLTGKPFGPVTALFHDKRYVSPPRLEQTVDMFSINNTLYSRVSAEFDLKRYCDLYPDIPVLFFGNLPPVSFKPKFSILYLQNCFLLPKVALQSNSLKVKFRLLIEKMVLRLFRHNIDQVWVQTKWMAEITLKLFSKNCIHVKPFLPTLPTPNFRTSDEKLYDLIAVTGKAKHKNLDILLAAIKIVDEKIEKHVSVLIVLDSKDPLTTGFFSYKNISLKIMNNLKRQELFDAYEKSRVALITSSLESFCLPLYEAIHFRLKLVAIRRPYSSEVSAPNIIYYDDNTPQSLARAILNVLV